MIGLPVLTEDGAKAGEIKDVWLDEFWNLTGVVLGARVWSRKYRKAIHWHDVVTCGEDALLIRSGQCVRNVDKSRMLRAFEGGVIRLKDMPVYTKSGLQLGRIADVYFKAAEGTPLIGFELTDGFLSDVMEGRRRLVLPEGAEPVTMGEHAILVPDTYERVLTRDNREMRKVTGDDG